MKQIDGWQRAGFRKCRDDMTNDDSDTSFLEIIFYQSLY